MRSPLLKLGILTAAAAVSAFCISALKDDRPGAAGIPTPDAQARGSEATGLPDSGGDVGSARPGIGRDSAGSAFTRELQELRSKRGHGQLEAGAAFLNRHRSHEPELSAALARQLLEVSLFEGTEEPPPGAADEIILSPTAFRSALSIFAVLSATDPKSAGEVLQDQPANLREAYVDHFASEVAIDDPGALAEWAAAQEDPDVRNHMIWKYGLALVTRLSEEEAFDQLVASGLGLSDRRAAHMIQVLAIRGAAAATLPEWD